MKTITVFTPTFNRAYCLHQCYASLVNQTNHDFIWMIVDDGSTDGTKELVETWMVESKIEIIYHFQENQGMHGAHNTAYDLINTELNVCIDSDDFMPIDAIDNIISFWKTVDNKNNLAGIVGLDGYKDGNIIGKKFPEDLKVASLEDLYFKYKIPGDKKLVLKTEVVNKFPRYPIFKEERFVPLGTLYLMIDKDYKLRCLNKVFCIVEYMEDGSSRNIIKQYARHPKGFRYARIITMKHSKYFKVRFKNAIHYVSHCIQLRDYKGLKNTPLPFLTFVVIPLGLVLHGYVYYMNHLNK